MRHSSVYLKCTVVLLACRISSKLRESLSFAFCLGYAPYVSAVFLWCILFLTPCYLFSRWVVEQCPRLSYKHKDEIFAEVVAVLVKIRVPIVLEFLFLLVYCFFAKAA